MTADDLNSTRALKGGRGFKIALAVSLFAHIFLFSLSAIAIKPDEPAEPAVKLEYIDTRMVKLGAKELPKNWMPHKYVPKYETDKAVAINPYSAQYPEMVDKTGKKDPKEEGKKDYSKDMAKVLEKFKKKNKELYKSAYENEGSPDGSPDGTLSSAAKQALANSYLLQISRMFKSAWEIPAIIAKEELPTLECTIEFRIDKNGKIKKAWVKKGSGNEQFDASALGAVLKTGSLPIPADPDFRKNILDYGMFYTFIPEEAQK